jgi:hypothetical protein
MLPFPAIVTMLFLLATSGLAAELLSCSDL